MADYLENEAHWNNITRDDRSLDEVNQGSLKLSKNQIGAQYLRFIIRLLHPSTCFEQ
jgi:hypothetical protein